MADSVDNFNDLLELGIDINESANSLSACFAKAANHLQTLLPNVDNQTLLTLYGYYKQGTEGACTTPKPSWYDLRAKSKWESWHKLGNLSQEEAKKQYIETLKTLDPSFDDTSDDKSAAVGIKVSSLLVQDKPSEITIVDYIRNGNIEEVQKYLKNNKPDVVIDGLSLFHWAADGGNVNILRELIKFGVDINLLDSDGQTALHYAASCGHVDCVKILLENGAKKTIRDSDGNTPYNVALDSEIKNLLK